MMESGAFGRQLAVAFRLADAPVIVSRTARDAVMAFTDLKVESDTAFRTSPMPVEDAYLFCLFQSDHPRLQVWEEGRPIPAAEIALGQTVVLDLRRSPTILVDRKLHAMCFYITREVLDDVADLSEAPRVGDLEKTSGRARSDETIVSLLTTVIGGFEQPNQLGKLFVDHIGIALATHVAQAYGGMQPQSRAVRGGLAPWQEKKVKEIVQAKLSGDLTVGELARECNLSHRHFCRAFRHTVGVSPHAYLQTTRIERAKKLLLETALKLTDVGSACGFADQSHFTRVFTQFAGVTPGVWRRNTASAAQIVFG